jgi:SsrA-binding protein
MADQGKGNVKIIATNRKARFEYHILQTYEAGLVLTGTEVKSLRNGKASLEDAYAVITREDEVYLYNLNIPEYTHGNRQNHEPKRKRKLLLHAAEISKIAGKAREKGMALVPTKLYFKKGWAKIELALAVGKKFYDKRQDMKKKDARREMDRAYSRRERD